MFMFILYINCAAIETSGGAMSGPAGHWLTQFSVWPNQFIGPSFWPIQVLSGHRFYYNRLITVSH